MTRSLSCLQPLVLLLVCCGVATAFQGGGGEEKNRTEPPPKSTAPAKPKAPKAAPRPAPSKPVPPSTADLSIKANLPGCSVWINGNQHGSITNQEGFLTLNGLKQGSYTIALRKAGYEEASRQVVLSPGMNQVALTLNAARVSLSVNVNPPGASIEGGGAGSYNDQVSGLKVHPGNYRITVSKTGYRTVERAITIQPGRPESVPVTLEKVTAEELLAQAERDFNRRNYGASISACQNILQTQPEQPRANYVLGMSYYNSEQYAQSTNYLVKAVTLGETVTLMIKHHRNTGLLATNDELFPGRFILSKSALQFTGTSRSDFSAPLAKIMVLRTELVRGGRLHLEVAIPNSKGKDEKKVYNFHPTQANVRQLDSNNPNSIYVAYCDSAQCAATLDAIYQLLSRVKQ